MIDPVNGAPRAEEESVTIGGVNYTMRCGVTCAYLLSEMGIEAASIFTVSERDRRVTSFSHVIKLFRATIAHHWIGKKQEPPSALELTSMLEGSPQELLTEITQKTLRVIFPNLMALTEEIKLRESAPAPLN